MVKVGNSDPKMNYFSIICDTSNGLRTHLFESLTSVRNLDFGLTKVEANFILDAPPSDVPPEAKLSIYLYHIEPNSELHNISTDSDTSVGTPIALNLHYLITPLLKSEDQNQMMLGQIIQVLHDQPIINQVGNNPIGDSLGGASLKFSVMLEEHDIDTFCRIWHTLGTKYRLSVSYKVRSVVIEND